MPVSALLGWTALALVPLTGLAGWILRHLRARGTLAVRMRPHFWLGYGALLLAAIHMWMSAGSMRGANANGLWLGTFGLLAMGVQAFIGTNLQSPGSFRTVLRRWHYWTFAAILVLAAAHIVLNAPFGAMIGRR